MLFADLADVFIAFQALSAARGLAVGIAGGVPLPITLAEIAAYLTLFPTDDVEEFHRLIRAADAAYLTASAKRREAGKSNDRG